MEEQQQQQFGEQRNTDVVFTKRIRAGRRTYFFDVRATRGNDYYLTITESKKRPDDTYVKHKIFVYKEDFNKFVAGLDEAVAKIKTELMPDFNFEQFDRPYNNDQQGGGNYQSNYQNQNGYDQQQPSQDGQPNANYDNNAPSDNTNNNQDYNNDQSQQQPPQQQPRQERAAAPPQNNPGNDIPADDQDLKW